MRLVVGLGNPGPRYVGSPHNVGFRVVDHFAERHLGAGRASWSQRFDAEVAMAPLVPEPLVLLKPLTFMNRSGESVRKAMSFFKKAIELDPKYANAYYQMGLATVGTNKMAEAAPYFTKYLELAPTGQDAETAKQMLDFIKKEGAAAPAAPAGGASKAQPGRK